MTTDNREFTVLGHPYRMLDPNIYGVDVYIQQERKAYFERIDTGVFHGLIRSQVERKTGQYRELEALLDAGRLDELGEAIYDFQEPRQSIRRRYEQWLHDLVSETSLDDILTICAIMQPIGNAPRLTPENLLRASTWQMREEMEAPMKVFTTARDLSLAEYRASLQASKIIPEASTPTTESST